MFTISILKVFFVQDFFQLFFLLIISVFLANLNFTNFQFYLPYSKIQLILFFSYLISFFYSNLTSLVNSYLTSYFSNLISYCPKLVSD